MKKFAPAFLALLVFILAACNGGDSDSKAPAMTVSVSMEVPPGAGIDADDISFSERDPNDYDGNAGAALTGFEFKPDGAQFPESVVVTLTIVNPPQDGLAFLHESDSSSEDDLAEGMTVLRMDFDETSNTLTVVAELSHFSSVWFVESSSFNPEWQFPDPVVVNVPFTVNVTVKREPRNAWPWIAHSGKFSAFGPVTPNKVEDRPSSNYVTTSTFTVPQVFTCTRPGDIDIWYWININFYVNEYDSTSDDDGLPSFPTWIWTMAEDIQCIAATPTPEPEDTPEPTPTITNTPDPLEQISEIFLTTPTPSPTPTQVSGQPTPVPVSAGTSLTEITPEPGWMLVFVLDGVEFSVSSLRVAGPDACKYVHVHGGPIIPIAQVPQGGQIFYSEHLEACGFGPPNFRFIPIPR